MIECSIIITFAFLLDIAIGDPVYRYHPVRLTGNLIWFLEKWFFRHNLNGILAGILIWIFLILSGLFVYCAVFYFFQYFTIHAMVIAWEIFVVYSCFAFRDMIDHAQPVYQALLKNNLKLARIKLKIIVGRDVDRLDKEGVIRATIESISESFVDGFLSPMFWFTAGVLTAMHVYPDEPHLYGFLGGAAILIYRMTNTMDSMIGYKNEKYHKFGKFSARMDDILNFVPARLSLFFLLSGIILVRANAGRAIKVFLRDRLKSESPNAAHSMSILAGALEISLGGPSEYEGELLNKSYLGDSKKKAETAMIEKTINIFYYSAWFVILYILLLLYKQMSYG